MLHTKYFILLIFILNSEYGDMTIYYGPYRANRVEDVNLRFYNGRTVGEYVDIPLQQSYRLLGINGFEKDNPTVLYMHGYIETAQQESIRVIVSAYLEARPDTNVVLIDWSNMAHGLYFLNAAINAKPVGIAAAVQVNTLIEQGLPLHKLHLIGFSLGCHVAGYLARELKNRYGKIVKRVTALDPALPGYYPGLIMQHISQTDAEFVDVIHTDAGKYGAPEPTGTVDFWPNGGKGAQPGCPIYAPILLSDDNLCSHWRSWRYYAESVRDPTAFPAWQAYSYQLFSQNLTPQVGMMYMGADCDPNARGSYYLTTYAAPPFGRRMNVY